MVRVFKNMRNSMIEKRLLADGVAPSYFIEGMLSNVPNDKFTGDYQDMWVACFNWIVTADETKLTTANDLHWLVRENSTFAGRRPTSTRSRPRSRSTGRAERYISRLRLPCSPETSGPRNG